jgi:geranylgeranyl pyrophosphate synthase
MANGAENDFEGTKKDWQFIYRARTGILFETACVFGVIAAGGSMEQVA